MPKSKDLTSKAQQTKWISKKIATLSEHGRWHYDWYRHRDPDAVSDELPPNALVFDWHSGKDVKQSIGKWIRVRTLEGKVKWSEITDFYYDANQRKYWVYVADGPIRMSDWNKVGQYYQHRSKWTNYELKCLRTTAKTYVATGDLWKAINTGFKRKNPKHLMPKYFILQHSKVFLQMVNEELKNALKKLGINEHFLLAARKSIIEQATEAEQFTAAEKALQGMERIFAASQEAEPQSLPDIGGFNPQTMRELEAVKQRQLKEAEEAHIISTNDTQQQQNNHEQPTSE